MSSKILLKSRKNILPSRKKHFEIWLTKIEEKIIRNLEKHNLKSRKTDLDKILHR